MDQLEATVEGTVYRNAENGYSVVTVKPEQKIGLRTVTVVGTLPMLSGGEMGIFTGEWIEHPQYGRQFKCQKVELQRPTTLQGILKYLSSGIIHGVGAKTARDIVNCFGEDTLKILDEHPERLQEVPNMGKKRWKQIIEDYQQQQSTRAAMVFLQTYGVSASLALKISKVYGERTQAVIRANPYQLCDDIDGVGFKTADAIGTAIGIPPDSDGRISAALKYVLRDQAVSMGHVYLPMDELLNRCTALLRVSREMVAHQLKTMQLLRELVISGDDGDEHVYLPAYDSAEREVATRLCELMASTVPSCATDAEDSIDAFEARYHIEFSQRQREAILMALRRGLLVITGGPGTGKTTIARLVSRYLKAMGVLSGGQLIEVTRADLVGKYVGHTAPLTQQVIRSALGGVLFIDEAYSLYRGADDSFGLEAIDTIVKGMEDHREDLIVILAGYTKEMEAFLTANSGLRSRFPNIIEFPDYTAEELLAITKLTAKKKGYTIDETCETPLLQYYEKRQATDARTAGNGRLVRNLVEDAILNQSRRLTGGDVTRLTEAELAALLSEDFDLSEG